MFNLFKSKWKLYVIFGLTISPEWLIIILAQFSFSAVQSFSRCSYEKEALLEQISHCAFSFFFNSTSEVQ